MLCVVEVQAQYIPKYVTYTVHLSMSCTILCIQIELKTWKGVRGEEVYCLRMMMELSKLMDSGLQH